MNKRMAAALLAAVLCLLAACACAQGITVTKKDMAINRTLDKSVSNVLMIMQDGDWSDTVMIASINSRTGRSVMTRVDSDMEIELTLPGGEVDLQPIGGLYALGDEKSRGLLVARELNELLNLNISTYVVLELGRLPEIVSVVGALNMQLDEDEARAMGTWVGINELTDERVLDYVRLRLPGDSPARSRGYDALMQLLYQGLNSGSLGNMMSLGKQLLDSMDTNLNVMAAVTMVSAVQGGTDRRELLLSAADMPGEGEMAAAIHREVYE
ncbi:MAG: hypothetical protein ACI4PG_03345 [Candidatus Ventricola sp.]